MDFSLNDEQRMLADTADRLVRDNYTFEQRRKHLATSQGFSTEMWGQLAELGLLAALFSEEDGGIGGGGVELMTLFQAFGRGLTLEPYLASVVLAGGLIARLGDAAQKDRLLGALIGGESRPALAYLEPAGGYDPYWIETRAEASATGWTLTGAKAVALNGDSADLLLVSARTAGDQGSRDGVSVFVVDPAAAGVKRRGYATIDGVRAAEIAFEGVALEAGALLGPAGGAADALDAVLAAGIAALCAEAVGAMEIACDLTLDYLKTRTQFGGPIGRFQALQHRMVDMRIALEQARSMAILAACSLDAPPAARDRRAAAAKALIGAAGAFVAEQAIQLHGGMGMTDEAAISHYAKRLVMIDHWLGDQDFHRARFSALPDEGGDLAA